MLPSAADLSKLSATFGPLTMIYMAKNATYLMLNLIASSMAPLQASSISASMQHNKKTVLVSSISDAEGILSGAQP